METFSKLAERDTGEMMKEIDFPYHVERAVGDDSNLYTTKDVVIRDDEELPLGLISRKRTLIDHKEIAGWVLDELKRTQIPFKLRDYAVNKKGDVYQEYVFDKGIDTPDGESMSPMLIAKQSYISTPLEIYMGTYRFVCSNGAMVGNTIESLKVKPNEMNGLLQTSLQNDLEFRLNRFSRVSEIYKDMGGQKFDEVLFQILISEVLPTMLKKQTLQLLADQGLVNILTEDTIKSPDFANETSVKALYNPTESSEALTGFFLYNLLTQITTHRARSATARVMQFNSVSNFFGI